MKTNNIIPDRISLTIAVNKDQHEKNSLNIMNAQGNNLVQMIRGFLRELDDFSQIAGEAGDEEASIAFLNYYCEMEHYCILAKINNAMRIEHRNEVRLIMKEAIKQAGLYMS